MHKAVTASLLALLCLSTSAALAQTGWIRTGTVDALVADDPLTLHTFVTQVDEDLADDIEDEAAREFATRVAGTDQHTATWMLTDPITAGAMEIAPAMLFILIDARVAGDPNEQTPQLEIEFGMDPTTHELLPEAEVLLEYHPAPYDSREYYRTTEGTVVLEETERVDEDTLSIRGTISGVLTFQGSEGGTHDRGDTLPVEATFDIDSIAGSSLLPELLGE